MKERVYRVGICDDVKEAGDQLNCLLLAISQSKDWDLGIEYYDNGEALLQEIDSLDIVFLDMEMPAEDGISVGQKIQRQNPDCRIIMESGYVNRFKEAFTIGAHRYITKPFQENEVLEAMESVIRRVPGQDSIELYYNRNRYQILQRDIMYVKAMNGYTEYHTEKRCYRKDISLQEAEAILEGELFMRVNRQLLVNFRFVTEIKKHYFCGQMSFTVSRRLRKEFDKRFIDYDLKYGR